MRTSLLALLLASSPAFADVRRTPAPRPTAPRPPGMTPPVTKAPASNLPPIDLDDVPPPCKATAKQGGAANPKVALPARISLARCIADTNLAPLQLLDCEDSIIAIDDATKASFELLAGVVAGTTDAVQQIIAERAKAELYDQMMVRMRQTLPSPGTTEAEIAMHEARKGILEGLLARWKAAAAASYERILATVKEKPSLERNPVVASAMQIAKDRLRLHVASAPAPATPEPDAPPASDDEPATSDGPQPDTNEQLR